jgi:cysteine-S-conjugate beta-lyase
MKYNFDEIIDRRNTACIKWDFSKEFIGEDDVLPMWVADMDFRTPEFVSRAIKARAEHEIYGYSARPAGYFQSIINWLHKKHQWKVEKDWIIFSPGIVPAVNFAVLAFTKPGDEIIVQPPVYFPFFSAVKDHSRTLVYNPLKLDNGRLSMDFEDLKNKINQRTKMVIISNPHNPGGSAWTKSELTSLAEFCISNNILILSDEIHSDLVFKPARHIVTATLSKEIANQTITMMAPSKTFNLAGLSTSSVIISNPELRQNFIRTLESFHIGQGNIFGAIASEASYSHGEEWLGQMLEYVKANINYIDNYLKRNIPVVRLIIPEATYMIWLDFRELNLSVKDLREMILKKAKLGLVDGTMFGPGGEGFQRMNVASPRSMIVDAMQRLEKAVKSLS